MYIYIYVYKYICIYITTHLPLLLAAVELHARGTPALRPGQRFQAADNSPRVSKTIIALE